MAAQSKTLLKGALHLAVMANVIPQRPPSPRERRAAAGVDGAFAGSGGHARMARSTELRSGARYRMLNGLANE